MRRLFEMKALIKFLALWVALASTCVFSFGQVHLGSTDVQWSKYKCVFNGFSHINDEVHFIISVNSDKTTVAGNYTLTITGKNDGNYTLTVDSTGKVTSPNPIDHYGHAGPPGNTCTIGNFPAAGTWTFTISGPSGTQFKNASGNYYISNHEIWNWYYMNNSRFRRHTRTVGEKVLIPITVDLTAGQGPDDTFGSCPAPGMPVYGINQTTASLQVQDRPLSYEPAFGPAVDLRLFYSMTNPRKRITDDELNLSAGRDLVSAPSTPVGPLIYQGFKSYQARVLAIPTATYSTEFTDLGARWGLGLIKFLEVTTASSTASSSSPYPFQASYRSMSGNEVFLQFSPTYTSSLGSMSYQTASSDFHETSRARLQYDNDLSDATGYERWERHLPDGSSQEFSKIVPVTNNVKRYYLTKETDPQGNEVIYHYDTATAGTAILTRIEDATGAETELHYEDSANPAKLTRIEDPYGRDAHLDYDTTGRLQGITDAAGLYSSFEYSDDDRIVSMTTPYGTTHFGYLNEGHYQVLQVTEPDGQEQRVEYWPGSNPEVSASEASTPVDAQSPSRIAITNTALNKEVSFFWNRKAMKSIASNGDALYSAAAYAKSVQTKWVTHQGDIRQIPASVKIPEQTRIWFTYATDTGTLFNTQAPNNDSLLKPVARARLLEGGGSQIHSYAYNDLGNLTRYEDPAGRVTDYDYDANTASDGYLIDLVEIRQGGDTIAQFQNYINHQPQTVIDAAGNTTSLTYHANGQLNTSVNALSQTITRQYYPDGNLEFIEPPTGGTSARVSFTWEDGMPKTISSPGPEGVNYVLTHTFDDLDRLEKIEYPDNSTEEIYYNRLDPQWVKDRKDRWTQYFYNSRRQLVLVQDPLFQFTEYGWCSCGSLKSIKDPNGNTTQWQYRLDGNVSKKIYPDLTELVYQYDATGRLETFTNVRQQVKTFAYNEDDTLAGITYSDGGTPSVAYTYDPAAKYRRLHTVTVGGTDVTTYTYHPAGSDGALQVHEIDGPFTDDTITYGYDAIGRVLTRDINGSANNRVQYQYDTLGRVDQVINPLGTFGYTFDTGNYSGKLNSISIPGGMSIDYDWHDNTGDQRLAEIHNQNSTAGTFSKFNYTYEDNGNIREWTRTLGTAGAEKLTIVYDALDRLKEATLSDIGTSSVLDQYHYQYDPAGNRDSEQVNQNLKFSTFNNLNQIDTRPDSGKILIMGQLDEPADVTVATNSNPAVDADVDINDVFRAYADVTDGSNTMTVTATDKSGNNNQTVTNYSFTVDADTFTDPVYDDDGNMLEDGTGRSYVWDQESRLKRIDYVSGEYTTFAYNAFSQRIRKTEYNSSGTPTSDIAYIWCGGTQPCEARDYGTQSTVLARYYPQGEERIGGADAGDYYYFKDHLGSISEMVDSSENVRAQYAYDPYGKQSENLIMTDPLEAQFGYTGHFNHDASGLVLTWYRAYDPELGIWLSRDPIAENGGLNLYGYVANNPIKLIDPLGLVTFKVGISVDANAGVVGIPGLSAGFSGTASAGFSVSRNFPFFDIGIVTESESTGSYTGAGANISVNVGASDACDLQDLEGKSTEIFADLGLKGPIGGGGFGVGNQRDGNPYVEVNGELGLGGQSIGGVGLATQNTTVYSAQGLGKWLGGLFK